MSRVAICFILFFIGYGVTDTNNSRGTDYEDDNWQTMQNFEEDARRQWELSVRKKSTSDEEAKAESTLSEHPETSFSENAELFTWFPWFEKGRPTIHTIKAIAALKKEHDDLPFPQVIGVGYWQEISLFGEKKDINSIEKPNASALGKSSVSSISNIYQWFKTAVTLFVCLLAL